MSLKHRLARLERTVVAMPAAPCPECGAPAGWVPSLMIKNDEGVQLTPTCAACGFTVMSNGKAITALPPGNSGRAVILDRLPPG